MPLKKKAISYDPGRVTPEKIEQVIEETGYQVMGREEAKEELADEEERKIVGVRKRMLWTWGFTVPIIAWMIPEMIMGTAWPPRLIFDLGMIILATPVMFWLGWPALGSAATSISHKSANMDVLITTVSYVTGFATLSLPIAMLGLLHPVIAEAAMAFSSVSVVTNANRLRKVDIRPS